MEYVSRCKFGPNSRNEETYKMIHAATINETYCGKELNEMWYVHSSYGMTPEHITCPRCIKKMKED